MTVDSRDRVELHLTADTAFTKRGWGKRVDALPGGRWTDMRGSTWRRFVTLPMSPEGQALARDLLAVFHGSRGTVIIGRPIHGDALSFTLANGADPSTIFAWIEGTCRGASFRVAEKEYDTAQARERARPGLLRREREYLLARLAEIDRELGGGERASGHPAVFWELRP